MVRILGLDPFLFITKISVSLVTAIYSVPTKEILAPLVLEIYPELSMLLLNSIKLCNILQNSKE